MKKTITGEARASETRGWLDLEELAEVEVSSEAEGYPIENALLPGKVEGWRAGRTGEARITLSFAQPQTIAQTRLVFREQEHERSQEWALRARFADGTERELLRQGWNFSPGGSAEQDEAYTLNLRGVLALTLSIDTDRGRNRYPASLKIWRLSGATA